MTGRGRGRASGPPGPPGPPPGPPGGLRQRPPAPRQPPPPPTRVEPTFVGSVSLSFVVCNLRDMFISMEHPDYTVLRGNLSRS